MSLSCSNKFLKFSLSEISTFTVHVDDVLGVADFHQCKNLSSIHNYVGPKIYKFLNGCTCTIYIVNGRSDPIKLCLHSTVIYQNCSITSWYILRKNGHNYSVNIHVYTVVNILTLSGAKRSWICWLKIVVRPFWIPL